MSWLVLTLGIMAVLLAAGLLLRKRFPRLSCTVWVLCAVYTIAIAAGTALCWQVAPQPDAQADYAVVLGYALQDRQPSQELIDRLQVGLQW